MWICCQLGAREHYAVPYALHREHELAFLITDAWADTLLPWRVIPGSRQSERFRAEIPSKLVTSFDWSLVRFELSARRKFRGWALTIERNKWFEARTVDALRKIQHLHPDRMFTVFSYSYTARKAFQFAKQAGWQTVLGQIDPGPYEEQIVSRLNQENGHPENDNPAPDTYWNEWREECELADRIVVNSDWSRKALCSEGIAASKLSVVPLVYSAPADSALFARSYPPAFNVDRPLRVLFLGQVNIRKGAGEILAAIPMLKGLPVELWMVGPVQLPIPTDCEENAQVKWFGAVPRGAAMNYYRNADVFLFPTFSDGFGLTQLEAQAWSLPLITSSNCGEVVRPLENGYLLPEITAGAIVKVIQHILAEPAQLAKFATASRLRGFETENLAARLMETRRPFSNV